MRASSLLTGLSLGMGLVLAAAGSMYLTVSLGARPEDKHPAEAPVAIEQRSAPSFAGATKVDPTPSSLTSPKAPSFSLAQEEQPPATRIPAADPLNTPPPSGPIPETALSPDKAVGPRVSSPQTNSTGTLLLAELSRRDAQGLPPERKGRPSRRELEETLGQAEALVREGKEGEAHQLLSDFYFRYELTEHERATLEAPLEALADRVLKSRSDLRFGSLYAVQRGDIPTRIAQPLKVPHEFLARLNGYGRYLRAGQTIKLVQGPFDGLVELSSYELVVLLRGTFIRRYRIGIGKDGSTPVGLFRVTQKVVHPTWYPSEGGIIPPDDPRNPLGTRWIGIGGSYGIHGTREPSSIGRAESQGCIRLLNPEVEELYDMLVEEHSRVLIRP
jgi:hypothetical protein